MVDLRKGEEPQETQLVSVPSETQEAQLTPTPNTEEVVPDVTRVLEVTTGEATTSDRISVGGNLNQITQEEALVITRGGVDEDYKLEKIDLNQTPEQAPLVLNPAIIPNIILIVGAIGMLIDILFYFIRAGPVAVFLLIVVSLIVQALLVSEYKKPTKL